MALLGQGGSREDELMRLLAEKRGRGGFKSDPMEPPQRPVENPILTQQGTGSPRMRAAELVRQKLRERMGGAGLQTRMGA